MRLRFRGRGTALVCDGHGRGGDIPAEHIHQRKRATRQENDPSRYTPTGFLNLFVHEVPCCPSVAARVLPPSAAFGLQRDLTIWQLFRKRKKCAS